MTQTNDRALALLDTWRLMLRDTLHHVALQQPENADAKALRTALEAPELVLTSNVTRAVFALLSSPENDRAMRYAAKRTLELLAQYMDVIERDQLAILLGLAHQTADGLKADGMRFDEPTPEERDEATRVQQDAHATALAAMQDDVASATKSDEEVEQQQPPPQQNRAKRRKH